MPGNWKGEKGEKVPVKGYATYLLKIKGLKKFYGVNSKEGLEFFEAHKAADVIHRTECEKLLDGLSDQEKEKAEKASLYTARYLWNFLSGMTSKHKIEAAA